MKTGFEKKRGAREKAKGAKMFFCFFTKEWQGSQWSAKKISLPHPSCSSISLPSNSAAALLLLLFASSFFRSWQPLGSFLTHFNGYLPNHVFIAGNFSHTTLREPKECSILSSAPPSARVCLACQCVCTHVCEWGGSELQ